MKYKGIYTFSHIIVAWFILILLSSCASVDQVQTKPEQPVLTDIQRAEQLAAQGEFTQASQIFWESATSEESPLRETYQIRAAELQIDAGNLQQATQYLALINEEKLAFELLPRKRIAQAQIALSEERFSDALELLPEALVTRSPQHSVSILNLRALALAGTGNIFASFETRLKLANQLSNETDITNNQNKIWQLLALAANDELNRWATNTDDSVLIGWTELARTKRATYSNVEQLNYALDLWRQNHPNHPASQNLLTSILEGYENYYTIPERIALLLPMSGRFAKIAEVIYAGIKSARELETNSQYAPDIILYDTGDDPNEILFHYERAVSDGADFIIGPLKKDAVTILSQQSNLPVPVLTLNYIDDSFTAPSQFFQFGLLPEDEARQVAERASLDEHFNAIVLAPIGDWGARIAGAFQNRFETLGGTILNTQFYAPNETDFSTPLQIALQLDQSELRYRQLRSVLGTDLEFEPHRRQDVDMIFLVATPRVARVLRPQINYYYANDVPIYSTSHIFSGIENITQDRDINGVVYCDIPWLLKTTAEHELIREVLILEAEDNYQLLPRFAALGIDAYQLPVKLAELSALPYQRFNGLTGNLKIVPYNKVYRELNWAKIIDGRPSLLPDYTPPSASN